MLPITLAGEDLILLPQRAVWWSRTSTLIITDPHFGKAATFRRFGIPVPQGGTSDDLDRLTTLLQNFEAKKLLILGDFFHHKLGKDPATLESLTNWRDRHPKLDITIVRGNHDRHAGDPPEELGVQSLHGPLSIPPFSFSHEPPEMNQGYTLSGHIHPSFTVKERIGTARRFPCFLFGPRAGLLPAFGSFTGMYSVKPTHSDQIYVIAQDEVVKIPG